MRNEHEREDARRRVLQTGIEYVDRVGLSLGRSMNTYEHLFRESGVSGRPSQLWPTPEAFFTDLFCLLADQARIDRADTETLLTTWQYLAMRSDELQSPESRRHLLIDIIRTAAEYNFDVVTTSTKWQTYAALSTTIYSWPDGPERERVLEALRASELAFVETMESFYRNVLPLLGYRLREEFDDDYQPFVVAAASVIEGLGIVRSTVPGLVGAHFDRQTPEGTENWSVAALAYTGIVDAFFEPQPDFDPAQAIARLNAGIDVSPADSAEEF